MESFKNLGLSDEILEALEKKGFTNPTPIQEQAIPILIEGKRDIVGQAQTGTGKTAAFGIPILETIDEHSRNTQALILAPTRELAIQVAEEIDSIKGSKRLNVFPVYGGQSIDRQIRELRRGVQIVVGTPGRILDHISRRTIKLENVSYVVLDEADEMLNMGFIDDVEEILKSVNTDKRMLLFSATLPDSIMKLAKNYMREYDIIKVKRQQLTTTLTDQSFYEIHSRDKFELLSRIIDTEKEFYGLIFCKTKADVDEVANRLNEKGYAAEGLHGDMTQAQREKTLDKFKGKKINVLVATDVAARGIDINDLTHVVNFDIPQNPESYVHRIGRTGRAGKQGYAITFVEPSEFRKFKYIQKIAKTEIKREEVPDVKDIISAKKIKIISGIKEVLESGKYADCEKMASDLLEDADPQEVLSAVLKYSLKDELSESNYKKIGRGSQRSERSGRNDSRGRRSFAPGENVRLFVALGKLDKMNPKKLVDHISRKSDVKGRDIDDVKVFEKFSFVTVSSSDAEIILDSFKNERRGRRSIIEVASGN
ncbi:DEAD/DEAH box helicase [Methanococcus maripaludis]|jgi:ATP-dependent RNA helicase DeaD|uniref:RNA helicase n=4 Tax=Methanococcus maripaludis TaxID=39152 RepID=A0A8T3W905_METMI|nr:DEAD/DEAH box helicase [Methanococcus maripaludis]MDK2928702.1 ATP-dependent helicase DeaD [Methanococcus sp.]AEK19355.1 DEAD/DEAH box helicase domain-containing protein [Methanococcus maripaludis X1]MBG0769663.1 DEAD/DEAH box helicase [Methanococcus maripaludis]BAP60596.1 ATP-dependent RNA helicase [Methanococcus maripaludis KA1]BAP62560.1 ATP-dependent RNA helicase [Methanococcus maripaludis OS7]